MNGKFTIDREFLSHDLWLSETFTRGQAWIDLVGLAKYQSGFLMVRGNRVPLERGDVGWSKVKLAKRWGWSRGKIERFINELKTDGRIDIRTDSRISTVISIKNYDLRQSFGQQTVQQTVQQTDNRQYTNKKEKKEKNNKEINSETFFSYFLKEGAEKVKQKAERFDLRDQDINFFANECIVWCKKKSIEPKNWVAWEAFFDKWINDGIYLYKKKRTKTMRARDEEKAAQPKKPKYESVEDYYLKEEGVTIIS